MESLPAAFGVLRKIALLTLLGFLVVLVAPPVLAVLSVVVPFALVGFVVWGAFQLLCHGRQAAWAKVREFSGGVWRLLGGVPRLFVWVKTLGQALWQRVRRIGRFFGGFLLETLGGAVVGGVLGAVGGMHYQDAHVRIPVGVAIGACIGVLAGASRAEAAKKAVAAQTFPLIGDAERR